MFNVWTIIIYEYVLKKLKFEYEGIKTARVTDYTNQTPLSISDG